VGGRSRWWCLVARLAAGEAAEPGPPPPFDARQWLADNGLLYDDFGISPDQWALQPAAKGYERAGKRFNPTSRKGESDPSLERGAESG
jgi:hypothetical protein